MRKTLLFAISFGLFLMWACEDDNVKDCSDFDLDFLYSIGYPMDSSYVSVEFSNASNNIATNAYIEWSINGDNSSYRTSNSTRFTENGQFSITMEYFAEGVICSVSKEFELTGIK